MSNENLIYVYWNDHGVESAAETTKAALVNAASADMDRRANARTLEEYVRGLKWVEPEGEESCGHWNRTPKDEEWFQAACAWFSDYGREFRWWSDLREAVEWLRTRKSDMWVIDQLVLTRKQAREVGMLDDDEEE